MWAKSQPQQRNPAFLLRVQITCSPIAHTSVNLPILVTGCLRPTPTVILPILAGIQPAELHRKGATLSLARRAMEPGHLLRSALTCSTEWNVRHFKLRHPFVCTRRTTTHHFIWQQHQKCGALGGSPIECRVTGQHHETPYFHPWHLHPPSWNDPSKNRLGPV